MYHLRRNFGVCVRCVLTFFGCRLARFIICVIRTTKIKDISLMAYLGLEVDNFFFTKFYIREVISGTRSQNMTYASVFTFVIRVERNKNKTTRCVIRTFCCWEDDVTSVSFLFFILSKNDDKSFLVF